ncbi:YggS family pyridoxal phosphate-dependent enzyme [Kibdelosporangium philippinense]|uniref:Pyridoxal phosphate homeostasis protein n=1 Tax=Kibdelosporangium philippinense TaxID=211113 RepID=A0ABS8ZI28_9PSEU|nr:YggS family pyridoxal phosphate-dependent enzyme [Kibdelosporangium philippinense]MCE7007463.1 YggS family pyridoxal phosphate-dependent enzyme [Kibdelosporangium philippinense]
MTGRREWLAANIRTVQDRIAAACAQVNRDPSDVMLLPVTKRFPASDAVLLAELGLVQLAENKDQEAGPKARSVGELLSGVDVRWHMVGQLQRNKARSVARWAAVVQSVDSPRLADALARAVDAALTAGDRNSPLDVLIQVSLDGDANRGGCPIGEVAALADGVAQKGELNLSGLMAVAPLGWSADHAFDLLAKVSERTRNDHPGATEMSAGMSSDLESAIAHGSTCVRVGTALLGDRPLISP